MNSERNLTRQFLPTGTACAEPFLPMAVCIQPALTTLDRDQFLLEAFASFNEAAARLERSYRELQTEVVRLQRERDEIDRERTRTVETNLRQAEYYRRILEKLPCGVLVVDEAGHILRMNPAARGLLGFKGEDRPRRIPEWIAPLLRCMEVAAGERIFQRQDAGWLSVHRAEFDEDGGRQDIFILRDVTESKRLEQMEEALRRRQALAEMSAVLAHEIRNPLGSLELFAGLLAESVHDPESHQWVRQIQAGLRMLAATVNNVLQFHSQPQPELVPIDLGQLLRWVTQFLAPLAEHSRVAVEVDDQLRDVRVPADRNRLAQVLLNIALNALRFMPEGGRLQIHGATLANNRHAAIRLTDSGPGIGPEHLERIFEAGFTTRPGSPGLGLAVCKAVMEQHHGTISAASTVGKGTTFTLTLPLWEEGR